MKKKIMYWILVFIVASTLCAILFFGTRLSWRKTRLPTPHPDAITTSTATDKDVSIQNKTGGYAITVPQNWYLEKSAGSGVTVYPDYPAAGEAQPDCKIEISVLSNPARRNLSDWLGAYLRRDPTADILEVARSTTTVGGAPTIIWDGVVNGVFSKLAYIATGTKILEIAPSAVAGGNSRTSSCNDVLQNVLKSLRLTQ